MKTGSVARDGYDIAYESNGEGPDVVFAHALGLDRHIWDDVAHHLPDHRTIRIDMCGHGGSGVPDDPYTMGGLIADTEAVCDALDVRDAVFVGASVGGMIGQGLAVKRLDMLRGLVLSNSAAKFGLPAQWHERAALVRAKGMAAVAGMTLEKWFGPKDRDSAAATWARDRLLLCAPEGYAGCCEAIAGTDFYTPTSGLRLPTLGIAGDRDGSTPPDLVRETIELLPGADFTLMRGSGHLPCLDAPSDFARLLYRFFKGIGHV
jgi:3-oxoadipate enol-lactonase